MSRRLGNFELVKPVGVTGSVWAARLDGGRGAYAVKVYEPPSRLGKKPAAEAIRRRIAAAEWQKKAGSSRYWAKVFDVGAVEPAGAYYATELFGWSVDQLIEQGVHV